MVLGSCARLLFRKLALRKGVTLTVFCLILIGSLLLYVQRSRSTTPTRLDIDVRKVEVPSLPASMVKEDVKEPGAVTVSLSNLSHPIELQEQAVAQVQEPESPEIVVLSDDLPECVFSATQPSSDHVDIVMNDVVDQLDFTDTLNKNGWNQGFDISVSEDDFKEHPLQVFVVPHSHNDPGWIKTFQDYYRQQTKNILNLMTDALSADKRRKLIWAEISYLDLWWAEQGLESRNKFKRLVENGQLEIVTGGWVMNDEANTHYYSMLDQLIEGHQWMAKNLPGVKPTSGWAIDPFGYTSTMPYLLQGTGVESMLIQRVHYSVKKYLAENRQLEFGWVQQWDSGYDSSILCHLMPFYSYDVPHTCGPHPKVCCQFDFHRLPGGRVKCPWKVSPVAINGGNIKERSETLLNQYRMKAKLYRTNVLLVPLGDDFRWDTQREIDNQFNNYFKLMDYINSHPEMHATVQFGTLSDYFKALRDSSPPDQRNSLIPAAFPTLNGDFFTYADRADHYWSGYYTSRPYHKNMDRVLQAHLRAAEVMYSLVMSYDLPLDGQLMGVASHLTEARRNLGLFQHHDGITGTAKDHVVVDYAKRLLSSVTSCQDIVSAALRALAAKASQTPNVIMAMTFQPYQKFELGKMPSNMLVLVSKGPNILTFVNPLTQSANQLITIHVNTPYIAVSNSSEVGVACQVSPVWNNGGVAPNYYRVTFPVFVPELGFAHYVLSQQEGGTCTRANVQLINQGPVQSDIFHTEVVKSSANFVLSSLSLVAKFSGSTGLLKSITTGSSEVKTEVEFVLYSTTNSKDKSGAYLFLPGGKAASITGRDNQPVTVIVGPLLQEVSTEVQSGLVRHTVQLLNSPGIDGRSVVISNEVDITRESNKEVAMRIHTSIANPQETFYTDNNGYLLVKRRTYSKLPLQGNFYPMPTSALIQDANNRVTLFTGQPLGVASLSQGQLEVILDRRLMQDDNRGLGQGVKDSVRTLEPFRLLLERRMSGASPTAQLVYHSLVGHATLDTLLHPLHIHTSTHTPQTLTPHTPLTRPFPCDLHLVNLRSLYDAGPEHAESALIIHRRGFDCGFDVGPRHCSLSNGKLKLSEFFKQPLSAVTHTSLSLLYDKAVLDSDSGYTTAIRPMEIHTYRLTW